MYKCIKVNNFNLYIIIQYLNIYNIYIIYIYTIFKLHIWMYDYSFLSCYHSAFILCVSIFTLNGTATDGHNCIKRSFYLNH